MNSPDAAPPPVWLPFVIIGGFAIVFPAFWCGVVWLISRIGGWSALAKRYRVDEKPQGSWVGSVLGMVGIASYRATLNLNFTENGFFMETMPLFRVGHPRLFIPWSDIESTQVTYWLFTESVRLRIGEPRITTITLPLKAVKDHLPSPNS